MSVRVAIYRLPTGVWEIQKCRELVTFVNRDLRLAEDIPKRRSKSAIELVHPGYSRVTIARPHYMPVSRDVFFRLESVAYRGVGNR